MKLKITVPFREKEEVIPLIEAGADELYCGYLSPAWIDRYTAYEFERKGGTSSNFLDLKELKEAVDIAHGKNIPVFLALNGLYVNSQYPLLLRIINQLEEIDFDAFIVADIGLLLTLRKMKTKKQIHLSTGGTAFNSEAVDFYRRFCLSRIVLDRQINLKAMKIISESNPDIDFEVFIFNTLCVHIDGFCTFLHTYSRELRGSIPGGESGEERKLQIVIAYDSKAKGDACRLNYSVEVYDSELKKKINKNGIRPTFYKHLVDGIECGGCAIYDIARTRIKSIKIVGRQVSPGIRLRSTKFIRACLDILEVEKEISRCEFIHKVQKSYQNIFGYKKRCKGNNCYHPEVLIL